MPALRWLRENVWSSKSDAGAWALERVDDRELVAAALAGRDRNATLGRERVQRFVDGVLAESEGASASHGVDGGPVLGTARLGCGETRAHRQWITCRVYPVRRPAHWVASSFAGGRLATARPATERGRPTTTTTRRISHALIRRDAYLSQRSERPDPDAIALVRPADDRP